MKYVSLYAKLAVFSALVFLPCGSSAHHESWHRVGLEHERYGLKVVPLSIVEKRFVIPREGCAARGDCDLKEVIFFVEDDEFPIDPSIPGDFLGRSTMFMAGIETESVAALRNYVFVQFIRGCMWNSTRNPDGTVTTRFSIARDHLGERTHFVHRDWTVDSMDREPAYSADGESGDRHFLLQWSDPRPKWIPDKQEKLFGEEKPTVPFGFVTDFPSPLAAFRASDPNAKDFRGIPGEALNRSLELRMCLYRTADAPSTTDGSTKGFGTPIVCYDWKSSHVFDHERGIFASPQGVHKECSRPLSKEEQSNEEFLRRMKTPAP